MLALLPALALLAAAASAEAAGLDPRSPRDLYLLKQKPSFARDNALDRPSVVAPYRYVPPPAALSPLDRLNAQSYRRRLEGQVLDLQEQQIQGAPDPLVRRRLLETQSELDRIDDLLAR